MRFITVIFLAVCLLGCDELISFEPTVGLGTHVETKFWMGSPYVRMKNASQFTLFHPCTPKTCAECSGPNAGFAYEIEGREVIPRIDFERNAWCRLDVTPDEVEYRGEIRLHVVAYIGYAQENLAIIEYQTVPNHDWDDETLSCEQRDRLFFRHAQGRYCPSGAIIDVPVWMLEEMQRSQHAGKYMRRTSDESSVPPFPMETPSQEDE